MSEEVKKADEAGAEAPASKAPKKVQFKKIKGVRPKSLRHPMGGFLVTEDMLQNPAVVRGLRKRDERYGCGFCDTFE